MTPVSSTALVAYRWRRGDACLAIWDDGLWYDARIADYGDDEDTFDILYKDGDFRPNVPLVDIAPLDQRDFLDESTVATAPTQEDALSYEDFGERSLVLSDLDDGSRVPDVDDGQGLEWETVADEQGRTFYFNRLTGESAWALPPSRAASPPQSPPPPEPYDETVHIDEYGVVRAQPSSARRTESFRSYSSRNMTPRSNPYFDDDSYTYDPSGSQAPAVARALEQRDRRALPLD
mgnify:FL=1